MKDTIFWHVTPYCPVGHRTFRKKTKTPFSGSKEKAKQVANKKQATSKFTSGPWKWKQCILPKRQHASTRGIALHPRKQYMAVSYVFRLSRDPTLFADSRSHCARVYDSLQQNWHAFTLPRESFQSHVPLVHCRTGLCPCKQYLKGRKLPTTLQNLLLSREFALVLTCIIFQFYYTYVPIYLLLLIISDLQAIHIAGGWLDLLIWSTIQASSGHNNLLWTTILALQSSIFLNLFHHSSQLCSLVSKLWSQLVNL
jgi:hypothetical protein